MRMLQQETPLMKKALKKGIALAYMRETYPENGEFVSLGSMTQDGRYLEINLVHDTRLMDKPFVIVHERDVSVMDKVGQCKMFERYAFRELDL